MTVHLANLGTFRIGHEGIGVTESIARQLAHGDYEMIRTQNQETFVLNKRIGFLWIFHGMPIATTSIKGTIVDDEHVRFEVVMSKYAITTLSIYGVIALILTILFGSEGNYSVVAGSIVLMIGISAITYLSAIFTIGRHRSFINQFFTNED